MRGKLASESAGRDQEYAKQRKKPAFFEESRHKPQNR